MRQSREATARGRLLTGMDGHLRLPPAIRAQAPPGRTHGACHSRTAATWRRSSKLCGESSTLPPKSLTSCGSQRTVAYAPRIPSFCIRAATAGTRRQRMGACATIGYVSVRTRVSSPGNGQVSPPVRKSPVSTDSDLPSLAADFSCFGRCTQEPGLAFLPQPIALTFDVDRDRVVQ